MVASEGGYPVAQKKIREEDAKQIIEHVKASKTPVTTEELVALLKEQSS